MNYRYALTVLGLFTCSFFLIQGCASEKDYETPRDALRARNIPYTVMEFMTAASEGKNDVLELFLEGGMDINTLDDGTALTSAVLVNQKKTVDFLLQRGANPNLPSYMGSPLYIASRSGYYDIAVKLIQAGAEAEYVKNDGSTVLSEAVRNDFLEVAELLINSGADPEKADPFFKRTPVFLAAANGNAGMIEMLCERDADPREPDINGVTSLDKAVLSGNNEAILLLVEKGALLTEFLAYFRKAIGNPPPPDMEKHPGKN